jgi:D-alanine-D-alanine ligase
MISEFGATLIEEFIEGREFSVLVVENAAEELQPFAYHPVEFRFPNGESFKHFDLKWKNYETMTHLQCDDDDLAERLKDISRKLFVGLNGSGYGRCDIRMNDRGELFMLEINPNCDIAYPLEEAGSADLILLHEPWGHREFFEKIIEAALSRHRRQRKKWKVLFSTKGRYATHAVETIKAGEMIHSYEEHTHVLVSQTHVRQNWNATQQQRFSEHAYPLSDEIFVSWSHEPEQWEPINHSCDPNTWLEGLNVVARRMISAGEEVTIDYATFHDERMPAFACKCHASECRGMIRGTDFTEPFMERYGDHVSDYIRRRRALAARR